MPEFRCLKTILLVPFMLLILCLQPLAVAGPAEEDRFEVDRQTSLGAWVSHAAGIYVTSQHDGERYVFVVSPDGAMARLGLYLLKHDPKAPKRLIIEKAWHETMNGEESRDQLLSLEDADTGAPRTISFRLWRQNDQAERVPRTVTLRLSDNALPTRLAMSAAAEQIDRRIVSSLRRKTLVAMKDPLKTDRTLARLSSEGEDATMRSLRAVTDRNEGVTWFRDGADAIWTLAISRDQIQEIGLYKDGTLVAKASAPSSQLQHMSFEDHQDLQAANPRITFTADEVGADFPTSLTLPLDPRTGYISGFALGKTCGRAFAHIGSSPLIVIRFPQ